VKSVENAPLNVFSRKEEGWEEVVSYMYSVTRYSFATVEFGYIVMTEV
jgi:hypothetical protein